MLALSGWIQGWPEEGKGGGHVLSQTAPLQIPRAMEILQIRHPRAMSILQIPHHNPLAMRIMGIHHLIPPPLHLILLPAPHHPRQIEFMMQHLPYVVHHMVGRSFALAIIARDEC